MQTYDYAVTSDINSFIIYPSRKSYFQAEELPKNYDLGEAPKKLPEGTPVLVPFYWSW